ncbi:MAG: dynamin family protein [Verrucomicrobiales bacterium]
MNTSQPNRQTVNLEAIANLMARVGSLEEQILEKPRDSDYFGNIAMVSLGLFRLVVMGEIKKGKSSFINSICGIQDLVPVHSDVATSTVFKIRYGARTRYTVYFQANEPGADLPKKEIQANEVNEYGTEDGNPDNVKKVEFVAVEAPSPVLKGGLIIVDTPGVGGLFKKHRDITFRHAPKADAVFFVTDSIESPIGADEVSFLKELRSLTSLVYFVQTKGDQVEEDARNRRMENNIATLKEKADIPADEIRYFIVSSQLKADADAAQDRDLLELSGYPVLMSYLQKELKPAKDRNIAIMGLRRARSKSDGVSLELQEKRHILDADNDLKRQEFKKELQAAEERLEDWNKNKRFELVREFQQEVNDIQAELQSRIGQHLRPGGSISEEIGETLLEHSASTSAKEIYQSAPVLIDHARASASQMIVEIHQEIEQKFEGLLGALAVKAGAEIAMRGAGAGIDSSLEHLGEISLKELAKRAESPTSFSEMRTAVYGGMVGVTIATVAGGLIGSVIPVVGTIVGSYAGMLIAGAWGGHQAASLQREKEVEAARREVLSAIEKNLGNIQSHAHTELTKMFRKLQMSAEDALKTMLDEAVEKVARQRKALQERSHADLESLANARKELTSHEQQLHALERELKQAEEEFCHK